MFLVVSTHLQEPSILPSTQHHQCPPGYLPGTYHTFIIKRTDPHTKPLPWHFSTLFCHCFSNALTKNTDSKRKEKRSAKTLLNTFFCHCLHFNAGAKPLLPQPPASPPAAKQTRKAFLGGCTLSHIFTGSTKSQKDYNFNHFYVSCGLFSVWLTCTR